MLRTNCLVGLLAVVTASCAYGQIPEPLPEHKILQRDVGRWDTKITIWMGEDGKANPNAQPQSSTGTEVNRKLGEFWVISTFKGEFGGMPFEGHAISGYDPSQQKFIGTWVDSMSIHPMHMTGTYDKQSETLTSTSQGVGMDGKPITGKSTLKYEGKDKRVFTMYDMVDGKEIKSMEIIYTRSTKPADAK